MMIKPLDLLVVVGSMHRCTYTTTLSTGWSTRDLSLVLRRDGITHLEEGFPLRCFQWLSLPAGENFDDSRRNRGGAHRRRTVGYVEDVRPRDTGGWRERLSAASG